jgi:hypothetical protein
MEEFQRSSDVTRPRRNDFSCALAEQDILRVFEAAVELTGGETFGLR